MVDFNRNRQSAIGNRKLCPYSQLLIRYALGGRTDESR